MPSTKAADLARYVTPAAYGFALIAICMIFSIWWIALPFRYRKQFADAQSVALYIAAQNKQKRQ
ncbi:MAG: hypothetical protein KTR15_03385 [Phycisphaeraceae bacterium]|nr:hypothetical protein [Phycisphaeraceae bacterium]